MSAMAAVNVKLNPLGAAIIVVTLVFILLYAFGVPKIFKSEEKINMKELLSVGIDLARRGGERVKEIRQSEKLKEKVKGQTKEGADEMLTSGDMESHRAIVYGFAKAFPALKVISEEHETKPVDLVQLTAPEKNLKEIDFIDSKQSIPINDITVWIDPLDATQEYTENLLEYVTVMVCVAIRGQPTIGIVHRPFQDELMWGWVGYGYSHNLDGVAERVKNMKKDHSTLIVSRSHAGSVEEVAKKALGPDTEVVPAGGAGYKTLEVIKGNADAYVHVTRIKKWDICAGNAIIMSVNGRMTTLEGRNIDYSAAGTPVNDDGLLATLNDHDKFYTSLKPVFNDMRDEGDKKPAKAA